MTTSAEHVFPLTTALFEPLSRFVGLVQKGSCTRLSIGDWLERTLGSAKGIYLEFALQKAVGIHVF